MIIKNDAQQDIVLIVEDTPANHDVMRTFLTDIGISCESAFDGMEAVTKCSSAAGDHYSLILMDLNLPHMDGIRTAESIRKLGITSPIISITATDKHDPRLSRASDVFNGVLFKPFNAIDFFTTVIPYMKSVSYCASEDTEQSRLSAPDCAENPDTPSELPSCDIDKGILNLGSNRKLFVKHFNNFKINNADLALRLSDMIRQNCYEDAAFLCHSIKGLSGMLGMNGLQQHMAELEEMLRTDAEADDPLSSHIMKQLAVISSDLRHICQIQVN